MNLSTLRTRRLGPRRADGEVKDRTLKIEGCRTRIRLDTSLNATVDCAQQSKDPAHFGEGTRRF